MAVAGDPFCVSFDAPIYDSLVGSQWAFYRQVLVGWPDSAGGCSSGFVVVNAYTFSQAAASLGGAPAGSGSASSGQFTADQVAALQYLADNPSPFNLSLSDGALIGSSVLACWALAAAFKAVASMFSGPSQTE